MLEGKAVLITGAGGGIRGDFALAMAAAGAAREVSGQLFAVRGNEIFLMSQSRPLRSVHRDQGWTAQAVAAHALPALRPSFYPRERSRDVFTWDPI